MLWDDCVAAALVDADNDGIAAAAAAEVAASFEFGVCLKE